MNVHDSSTQTELRLERCGIALRPSGDTLDAGGVLNPACARTRSGELLLYPRLVQEKNISRIGLYESVGNTSFTRAGMALEPQESYEFRDEDDGYGCEDPRVTFMAILDYYLMAYTAFGPTGPRIAIASSPDARTWTRIGLVDFGKTEFADAHDKDAAFFPEPVHAPDGTIALAMYHRPSIQRDGSLHEDIQLAYIPFEAVRKDIKNVLKVHSSVSILEAGGVWGNVKVGAGTPPIRTNFGWLSLFHGVDRTSGVEFNDVKLTYRAGILVHDLISPHLVKYVSAKPVLAPEAELELAGVVDSVVFPTAIDIHDCPPNTAMVYYGMADAAIGLARLEFGALQLLLGTA